MLIADFTNGGVRRPATLTISELRNGQRIPVAEHNVEGRRQARKLAVSLGAKPWNF